MNFNQKKLEIAKNKCLRSLEDTEEYVVWYKKRNDQVFAKNVFLGNYIVDEEFLDGMHPYIYGEHGYVLKED